MFEEDKAWEEGFRAALLLVKSSGLRPPSPASVKEAIGKNPYVLREPPEPEPNLSPPDPLPITLDPPWKIYCDETGFGPTPPVESRATLDTEWMVYRWTSDGDSQGCCAADVDWRHHALTRPTPATPL